MMVRILIVYGLIWAPASLAADDVAIPEVLVKAHEARMAPRTGYLEYVQVLRMGGNAETRSRFIARIAGEDLYLVNSGDSDGVVLRQPDGTPLLGVNGACVPQLSVVRYSRGEYWTRRENDPGLNLMEVEQSPPFLDPRQLGLHWSPAPFEHPLRRLQDMRENSDPAARYRVESSRGLTVVTCEVSQDQPVRHRSLMVWTIDEGRGNSISQIELLEQIEDGALRRLCQLECQNELFDGYWWPRRIESRCEGTGFYMSTNFTHVEFDRPDQPAAIDPDMLGAPPGAMVGTSRFSSRRQLGRYLGAGEVITEDEFHHIKSNYDLDAIKAWAENVMANRGAYPAWWDDASGRFGLEGVEHKPDEWEAYVRRWILKRSSGEAYKLAEPLTEKQKTAAWAVLADCKKRSHPIVEKRAAELAEARKRLGENRKVIEDLRAQTGATEQGNADQGKGIAAATPAGAKHATAAGGSAGEMPKPSTGGSEEAKPVAREDERLTQAMQASQRLLAAVRELEKPDGRLAEIFEELKRRLDGLLTSVQRSDANVLPPPAVKPQSMRDGSPAPLPQRDPRQAPQAAPRTPTPARP